MSMATDKELRDCCSRIRRSLADFLHHGENLAKILRSRNAPAKQCQIWDVVGASFFLHFSAIESALDSFAPPAGEQQPERHSKTDRHGEAIKSFLGRVRKMEGSN